LAPTHSTRPTLPLSPRFEHRAWALACPYAPGGPLSKSRWRHSRLFLFYLSLIDLYIPYTCIVTMRWNIVGRARNWKAAMAWVAGDGGGRQKEDGGDVCLRAKSWHDSRPSCATWAIPTPQLPATTPVSLPYLFIPLLHIQCLY
jgi:hypothetical protein